MAKLSPMRESVPILKGIPLINRGKVRDTYDLGNGHLLAYATNSVSIFDIILNALIPDKGMVLTAMTHFWMTMLEEHGVCKTHMIAAGAAIDEYLPKALRGNPNSQSQAMVVKALKMSQAEFVGRGYLTGSVLKGYQETGKIFGLDMPTGLQDGDELPFVLDTPTTKATEGHDLPMDRDSVRAQYPEETETLLKVYSFIRDYAKSKGIIFADTKFEFGRDADGNLVLGDEAGTPDSSRFWSVKAWEAGRKPEKRKAPPPFDKQMVRQWGIEMGINKLDPGNPEDVAAAQRMVVPLNLISTTTEMYHYIFWLLTGMRVSNYVSGYLGVPLEVPKRNIAVIFGSRSDLPAAATALAISDGYVRNGHLGRRDVHILSCHRNPLRLREFVEEHCEGVNAIIAVGGKAFALPGVLDAFLYARGKKIPVIGVALGEPGSMDLLAAELSISQLPGQPVIMDEQSGVYSGSDGLQEAISRATFGEMPPIMPRAEKRAEFFIPLPP